jgi:hypothetical protein
MMLRAYVDERNGKRQASAMVFSSWPGETLDREPSASN